jgi:hypothetical protein
MEWFTVAFTKVGGKMIKLATVNETMDLKFTF